LRAKRSNPENLLTLTENAGFGFAEINKLAPHLSMKPKASSKKDFKDFDLKDFKRF